ncbi:hypothetical protein VMCG_06511 [Cytospora schulzeri]|uniref:Uncharacterized protein n=1 Tax=Cytospora schulzeri TaxID=448051 RepID=A0A423WBR6_9PEZI|nr:hypothetical protein VMCG_06511 [Valsa malicola]
MVSIRRPRRAPRNSWSTVETGSMSSMSYSDTSSRPRSRNTGFPEPFCGNRNTTLPHPDANTSPDACISQDDISVTRVQSRQRRSFLAKNKRATSHGIITPEMEQMYSEMVAVYSDSEASPGREDHGRLPTIPGTPAMMGGNMMARPPSKDGGASFASDSTNDDHDHATTADRRHHRFHMRLSSDGGASAKSGKRRNFMQKLGISHHRQ